MPNLEIAAAYVRVSTDDQTELSPDAQVREILKAAKAEGYVIPKEFIFMEKKGISGRKADNRPEFQRMIAIAKQTPAPFSRLYLWKFSRFARNQDESTFRNDTCYYWDGLHATNAAGDTITAEDFVSLTFNGVNRHEDGSIDLQGFLQLK